MTRPFLALLSAGLLAGCAGTTTGSQGWGGGSPGGVRWSPYGGVYGAPGGGYWRDRDYGYREAYGYGGPSYRRGYGGRTFRPDRNVVCDRATETCYRGGEIDASETRDHFGNGAARRVDRLRDDAGTNSIFRPDDDVVCNRRARFCEKDGRPDRSETRDFFGKKAARRLQRSDPDPG